MSTGSVFLRRFTTKTIAQLFASDVERNGGNARRNKTSAFVTGGEFGGGRKAKEDAKNLNAGGERMTLSIESNAHKLERMTPVFGRELMAFVSANKSELYEKKRKKKSGGGSGNNDGSGSNAVVSRRENEEDFRQPTSQFLSIFGVGTNNNRSSDNMTLALTDESCIRPSELAKKHFPALMNALRDVNGMNVRLVALRPSYRYEEKKKENKKKSKVKNKTGAEKNDTNDTDEYNNYNINNNNNNNNNNTRRKYYLEEIVAKSNRLNRRTTPKRFPLSDSLHTAYVCLAKDVDCDSSDVGVEAEFLGHPVQKMPLEVGEVVCVDCLARSRMFNAGEAVLLYNENEEEDEDDEKDDDDNERHLLQKNIFAKTGKGCVVLVFDMLDPKYERNGTARGIAKCVEEMTRVFGNEKSSAFEKLAVSVKCNLS